jgi:hypothetical protein
MSIAAGSPAPPIAARCIKVRREFLGILYPCQCGGLLPVDPVRRTLVLHQSAPDLHAGVASRKLRYLLQAAFRRH